MNLDDIESLLPNKELIIEGDKLRKVGDGRWENFKLLLQTWDLMLLEI